MSLTWCSVDGAEIGYTDRGEGCPIVFVHGVYVTGALWDAVSADLEDRYRCIVPTWPHGAHSRSAPNADLSAPAAARRIVHLLECLELTEVTIVANNTGGALVLIALGDDGLDLSRITRIVLTNCDTYEHFPPRAFAPLVAAARYSPRFGAAFLWLLSTRLGRRGILLAVCRHRLPTGRASEIFGSFATSSGTRRDGLRLTASLHRSLTLAAAPAITTWTAPVHLVWGDRDRLFPLSHGRRLDAAFPDCTLTVAPESSTYVMLDAPQLLIAAIDEVITRPSR